MYTDYRRILDRSDIDLVHIATPSGLHCKMTLEALNAGKNVLVEKPLALSLADADAMIAAAQRTGRKLGVVMQNRFNPPMRDMKQLVEDGKLGRLVLGNATVRWYRPQAYYEDGWHGTWAMDGGALMNQSIHHIDALQWLMGDVTSVYAFTDTLAHKMEAEDVGVATIRFASGAIGGVEGSTVTYPENLEGSVALFGTKGSAKVGGTALNRKEFWKVAGELESEKLMLSEERANPSSVYGSSHAVVIARMGRAVRDNEAVPTTAAEARKSLALVLAMYESSRTGQPIDMRTGSWSGSALPNQSSRATALRP